MRYNIYLRGPVSIVQIQVEADDQHRFQKGDVGEKFPRLGNCYFDQGSVLAVVPDDDQRMILNMAK